VELLAGWEMLNRESATGTSSKIVGTVASDRAAANLDLNHEGGSARSAVR